MSGKSIDKKSFVENVSIKNIDFKLKNVLIVDKKFGVMEILVLFYVFVIKVFLGLGKSFGLGVLGLFFLVLGGGVVGVLGVVFL